LAQKSIITDFTTVMKNFLLTVLSFLSLSCLAEETGAASHIDLTHTVLDFLSRTELCLNSCRDAESVAAAIPQLRELEKECGTIVDAQRALPEPTVQDYMAVQNQMEAFNTLWTAIRNHIERMEQEQILTAELREILHIAPVSQQN
jgi:hypothetical protein